ncbi:MAG TPA: histidine kinase, partial [Bacteroidales bacterium]|nr:histidine kinase [Bacteroidales bacterium]
MRTQLEQMGEEERIERQMAIERELLLLRTDQVILDEIRNVLILFEKEEINRAIEGSEKANVLVKRLWNTALVLATVGLLTMLVFIVLIWKDLARSAFYRRQLEKARLLAEKLLKVKELFLANMSHEI